MNRSPDGGETRPPSLSCQLTSAEVTMDPTMCGLLVDRAAELARLYAERGNWNDVERTWFEERLSSRSTRGRSRTIYRVLRSRFENAPPSLQLRPATEPYSWIARGADA